MPPLGLSATLDRVRRAVAPEPPSDGRLLTRFLRARDEPAFAELVRRHGPMVLGVCRRLTADRHLAEDAFQAVFLTLARKADRLAGWESVGGWLCQVARRVGRNARRAADRHRRREVASPSGGREHPASSGRTPSASEGVRDPLARARGSPEDDELGAVVLEELAGLPDRYRSLLVLHYLEGRPQTAVAAGLGLPAGTVNRRMAEARRALGDRLRARGVAPALAGPGVGLVPAGLSARAVAGAVFPHTVPAAVAALSSGAIRTMLVHNLKLLAAGGLVLAAVAAAVGGLPRLVAQDPPKPPADKPAADPAAAAPAGPGTLVFCRNNRLTRIDPAGKNEAKFLAGDSMTPALGDGVRPSPDGRHVAYLAQDPDATDPVPPAGVPSLLYVAGADAGEGRSLGVSPRSFAWSRDGRAVAVSEFPAPDEKLAAVHALVDVKTKERTALDLPDDHYVTDWSGDGKYFLTTRLWPEAGVFLVSRDGTERKHLTEGRLPAGRYAVGGRLSPDGRRVLLTVVTPRTKEAETRSELAVLATTTGAVTPVADTPRNGDIQSYCWSPDGKRIAYVWSETPAGQQEVESAVVVCDPDGKNATTVASEKGPVVTIVGLGWR